MADYQLALEVGIDVPIPELQLTMHPPTIKEIAFMGEHKFFQAMQYLCLDKEALIEDETVLATLTNFQVLMKVLEQSKDADKKIAISTLLMLLFPEYKVVMMPKSIIVTGEGDPILIDDNNFDIFQEAVKQVLCTANVFQGKNIVYNPANSAAKRIADKIMRGRKKVAEIKAKEEGDTSVLTRYLSILLIGPKIPLKESSEYNLFQLFDAMERYGAYVEWETDLKVKLAGGKTDKQVETWMRNLYSMK